MASAINKNICAKCSKGAGTAMCHGCEQAFCTKHFIEHRQELAQQLDSIGQEHDILQRDLIQEPGTHPFLTRINEWEQESIFKIQTAAKRARDDLQELLNQTTNNLKISVSNLTEALQSSRESDDYTELDIRKWTNELKEYRKMLDSPLAIKIDYENGNQTVIRMIKVSDRQPSNAFNQAAQLDNRDNQLSDRVKTSVDERFVDTFGNIELSENGLIATCLDPSNKRPCVDGVCRYSSNVHYIRFQIINLGTLYCVFLGIVNASEELKKNMMNSMSCYGWWDFDYHISSGERKKSNSRRTIRTGDEVTLMLDCDNRRIQWEHHRTNRTQDISVDLELCPFPWKVIVLLNNKDDCIRILH